MTFDDSWRRKRVNSRRLVNYKLYQNVPYWGFISTFPVLPPPSWWTWAHEESEEVPRVKSTKGSNFTPASMSTCHRRGYSTVYPLQGAAGNCWRAKTQGENWIIPVWTLLDSEVLFGIIANHELHLQKFGFLNSILKNRLNSHTSQRLFYTNLKNVITRNRVDVN